MCTGCREKGSLGKRLLKCELESAHAAEQLLASERLLEERQRTIECLLVDKQELLREKTELLSGLLKGAKKMPPLISESDESVLQGSETDERVQSSDEQPSDSEHNEDDSKDSVKCNPRLVQPPGFKEIAHELANSVGEGETMILAYGLLIMKRPLRISVGMMKCVSSGFLGL